MQKSMKNTYRMRLIAGCAKIPIRILLFRLESIASRLQCNARVAQLKLEKKILLKPTPHSYIHIQINISKRKVVYMYICMYIYNKNYIERKKIFNSVLTTKTYLRKTNLF